jgi:hypothetical protein
MSFKSIGRTWIGSPVDNIAVAETQVRLLVANLDERSIIALLFKISFFRLHGKKGMTPDFNMTSLFVLT